MDNNKQSIDEIRVLIADDHLMILEGMVMIISSDSRCNVVAKASNGEQAIRLYQEYKPDVVILDIIMPGLNGVDVIKKIRAIDQHAKIIVLSAHDAEEYIYKAIQSGAMAYVLKEELLDELISTIHDVYQGKSVLSNTVATKYIARNTKPVLSERELEILQLIAEGQSNQDIAENIYIAEGTVRVHVHNILKKMDTRDRASAVIEGLRRGIITLT